MRASGLYTVFSARYSPRTFQCREYTWKVYKQIYKRAFCDCKACLRYLHGTREYRLFWKKHVCPDLNFNAFADADLGSEKDDGRSITGFVLQINGCTHAYKSRKQIITHEDTCSTEFIAAAECSVMIVWTHNLCEELNLRYRHPTALFQDNQSTIKVIKAMKGNYKSRVWT